SSVVVSRLHRYPHSSPTRRSSDLAAAEVATATSMGGGYSLETFMSTSTTPDTPLASPADVPLRELAPAELGAWRGLLRVHSALRSEEHTSELQSRFDLVCRLLLEK